MIGLTGVQVGLLSACAGDVSGSGAGEGSQVIGDEMSIVIFRILGRVVLTWDLNVET